LHKGYQIGALTPILMARASGHGVGKSTVAACVILWGLSTVLNTRVVVTGIARHPELLDRPHIQASGSIEINGQPVSWTRRANDRFRHPYDRLNQRA